MFSFKMYICTISPAWSWSCEINSAANWKLVEKHDSGTTNLHSLYFL
jgi:hypothetical protein